MKQYNLKINIEELRHAGKISRVIDPYYSGSIEDAVKSQHLKLSYSAEIPEDSEEVVVKGEIKGELTLECCRCLETYTSPVCISLYQAYPVENPEIDIEDEVRQVLILNLPGKPLCKESCAGLCQDCGKNLNLEPCKCSKEKTDPKWEKLKDIMK